MPSPWPTITAVCRPGEDPQYDAMQSVTLPIATADTGRLIGARSVLFPSLPPGFRYKAGVVFLDLASEANVTGGLFARPNSTASQVRLRS